MEKKRMCREHQPEINKIPDSLRPLPWRGYDPGEDSFYDGDELLVAVLVCDHNSTPAKWHYEFSVITIHCDEHYLSIECEDESWGWELDDIDFFVRIR